MVQSFIEQEREARAYNKAFLHGKEIGLNDGKKITIDRVLEIIDGYKSKATEPTKLSASTYNILLDRMKHEVLALKGGEQEC